MARTGPTACSFRCCLDWVRGIGRDQEGADVRWTGQHHCQDSRYWPSLRRELGTGGADGVIVFSTQEGLWRVPATGGAPVAIVKPGPTEYQYVLPHLLPQGDAVVFTIEKEAFQWDTAQVVVRSLTIGAQTVLMDDAADTVRGYDVTRDGQRFLMVQILELPPQPPTKLVLVSNWLDELRRRVPVP